MPLSFDKMSLPDASDALPGRESAMQVSASHFVNHNPIIPPFPSHLQLALFGLGCFWGAERKFWSLRGVFSTAVGYSAGFTPNPNYKEVCSGLTGHNEVVRVVYDPKIICYQQLLEVFWQSHNPTQGMRQGNDHGTQYRSGVYTYDAEQQQLALSSRDHYQQQLTLAGQGEISSEIMPATVFYYAEDYHQQYLAKNPQGYCGLGGLQVPYAPK